MMKLTQTASCCLNTQVSHLHLCSLPCPFHGVGGYLWYSIRASWKLSVTWPPLFSGQKSLAGSSSAVRAHEKDDLATAAYFLPIRALQRKKRRTQTRWSYPHEYLAESSACPPTPPTPPSSHHHPPLSLC